MYIMCLSDNLQGTSLNYSEVVLFKGVIPLLFLLLFLVDGFLQHSVMNIV